MSGVLFVVYIPTKDEEKKLRGRYEEERVTLDMEKDGSPLTTPEMQRIGSFHKNIEGFSIEEQSTDSASLNLDCAHKSLLNDNPKEVTKTRSCDRLSALGEASETVRKSWEGFRDYVSQTDRTPKFPLEDHVEYMNDLALPPDAFMEDIMTAIMKKKSLRRVTWLPTRNNEGHQILFNIENGSRCDDTIRLLSEWGVGEREGTSVSVLPCTLYYEPIHEPKDKRKEAGEESFPESKTDTPWNRFVSSVRARLNVAEIVHEVKASATITFDFLCLVVVAGILAAFGLVENSTLFLAASMLISPLMGPIIAGIFGSAIKDHQLRKMGVINELIGIFAATSVGFIFGFIMCSLDDRYSVGEGLTNEILSRCELHSLVVGILIAIPSGAAVAIAILGDNTGSLVGVAISASLLPPAVNAGLLWALSCVYVLFEKDQDRYNQVIKTSYYSEHQSVELAIFGCISMCLTLTNVICIYVMGVIFLKIKEVAPIHSHRQFWHHDVKIARDYNKTIHSRDAAADDLVAELASLKMHERVEGIHGVGVELFKQNQNTWSPHFYSDKPHVKDLEALYLTLAMNSNNNTHARLFSRHHSIMSPPTYKSIPDENILSPSARRRTQPVDTPPGSSSSKQASNSFPHQSNFLKGHGKKRFVVTPSCEDPLNPK